MTVEVTRNVCSWRDQNRFTSHCLQATVTRRPYSRDVTKTTDSHPPPWPASTLEYTRGIWTLQFSSPDYSHCCIYCSTSLPCGPAQIQLCALHKPTLSWYTDHDVPRIPTDDDHRRGARPVRAQSSSSLMVFPALSKDETFSYLYKFTYICFSVSSRALKRADDFDTHSPSGQNAY